MTRKEESGETHFVKEKDVRYLIIDLTNFNSFRCEFCGTEVDKEHLTTEIKVTKAKDKKTKITTITEVKVKLFCEDCAEFIINKLEQRAQRKEITKIGE